MSSPSITVTLSDFTVEASGAGYPVQMTPGNSFFGVTDEQGQITFASVPAGIYTLNMPGAGVPSLRLTVPDGAGSLDAIDLLNVNQGFVAPGGSPEGRLRGNPQDRFYDAVGGKDYVKATGTGTTGWQELVG